MKNEQLQHTRHTLAHLLAAAVVKLYPESKLTLGPAIDNGFYYDIDFGSQKITDADLRAIEKEMRKILPAWQEAKEQELSAENAKAQFAGNEYKLELIDEISSRGEKITTYTFGEFTDLCRGGHAENAQDIPKDSFELSHTAGAYWRGDEKNKMLTRIYGLAFATKDELGAYKAMLEEAKKRDHKKLGPQLDLFVFSELVGPGLPLWTPKGTLVKNLLDDYVWQLRKLAGYVKVDIPHITKKELYETSGHWDKFKDELFRIKTREGHEFAMKPMNCPHHTQIYARKKWSYRELPQRYANTTMCYRDEQTGELAGLSRVRAFAQDDAHVFCRLSQVKEEFEKVWDIVHAFYSSFGFSMRVRISKHDPMQPEKYLGNPESWKQAESILEQIAAEKQTNSFVGIGEAAFYGPKLDFMAKDAIGREWQVATIQLDMNMPERFDLTCINEQGETERIVMVHAAIMGSIERFLSILIEHTAGNFPLWLSPVQVAILPISEKHAGYARKIAEQLRSTLQDLRFTIYDDNESIGKKIREATVEKIPYQIILGDKEMESKQIAIRKRDGTDLGSMDMETFSNQLFTEIQNKTSS